MKLQMIEVFLAVFVVVFASITVVGFFANRSRSGDLNRLQEWGLAGRRFGTLTSWFLMGGANYTAYTILAVPGLMFAGGALSFYIAPFSVVLYPVVYVVLSRFWVVAKHRGYVTSADFVRERFGSSTLALIVSITGLLATLPYVALQILGMQIVLAEMGIPSDLALIIAFTALAVYTYISGLRAPAVIAIFKAIMLWLVVIVAWGVVLTKFGSFAPIFASVPRPKLLLSPKQYSAYVTLTVGSGLSLGLYPHALTSFLSASGRKVLKRNAFLQPAFTILISLIGLLGLVALNMGIAPSSTIYKTNMILPALFEHLFPPWFAGFAFATLAISAFVPAAVMSISASNIFTRNIYREYFRPSCNEREETNVARLASLCVKVGALAFILFFPVSVATNVQLLTGIWILQTLPAVFIGLYTNWFHSRALVIGWLLGMITGTWMAIAQSFQSSVYPLSVGSISIPVYSGLASVIVNLLVSAALTLLFRTIGIRSGEDATAPSDYEMRPVFSAPAAPPAPSFPVGGSFPGTQFPPVTVQSLQPGVQRNQMTRPR